MALPVLLPLASFFDKLPLLDVRPFLPTTSQISGRTGDGQVLTASLGDRLWRANITLKPVRRSTADELLALISYLEGESRFFLAHPFPRRGPRFDPAGIKLAGITPTISALSSNNREMRIKGLPPEFELNPGDFPAFTYGASPLRYGFHRIVGSAVKAGANGITPVFEVEPPLRPGAAIDAPVTLFKPVFKAMIDPGSVQQGNATGRLVQGIAFNALQVMDR